VASSSSSNEETDASSKEEAKDKKGKREIRDLITMLHITMIICLTLTTSPRYPLVNPPFRWDRLHQMELLDEDASNLTRSECLEYCACRC
jgi:hypothetical protein